MKNLNTPDYWDKTYSKEIAGKGLKFDHRRMIGRIENPFYFRDYKFIFKAINRLIPADSSVLDVGCGMGILDRLLKKSSAKRKIIAFDLSSKAIEYNIT